MRVLLIRVFARLLGASRFPVWARLESRLPITIDKPLQIPVKGEFAIDLEDAVWVEGRIPVRAEIPIDTVVETEVLKYGRVRIPIKAKIPISVDVPISAQVQVRLKGVRVVLDKELEIPLPTLSVPLDATIKTDVSLMPPEAP